MARLNCLVTAAIVLTSALSTAYADDCIPVYEAPLCNKLYNRCNGYPVDTHEIPREYTCEDLVYCGDPIPDYCQVIQVPDRGVAFFDEFSDNGYTYFVIMSHMYVDGEKVATIVKKRADIEYTWPVPGGETVTTLNVHPEGEKDVWVIELAPAYTYDLEETWTLEAGWSGGLGGLGFLKKHLRIMVSR